VIGFLSQGTAASSQSRLVAVRQGLSEVGFVEGRNAVIEYGFAEGQFDRLPALAADLVHRRVAVIIANGPPAARAAKGQSDTIAIVFAMGQDPVKEGLVASLNRTGGNITGVSFANNLSESKRLGLLHAMVPGATTIGVLMNPDNASIETQSRDLNEAARTLGLKLQIANARNENDFEPAFSSFVQQRAGGLIVTSDAFFSGRIEPLVAFAARYAIPTIYGPVGTARDAPAAGGLMSYGRSASAAYHQAGIYAGRILHGEKPGDLPVMLPTKFELVINLKTAKELGLTVPPSLLAIADEVIE
jgi:putative tryptophan/tyrosine transport system substrate-binding protein